MNMHHVSASAEGLLPCRASVSLASAQFMYIDSLLTWLSLSVFAVSGPVCIPSA